MGKKLLGSDVPIYTRAARLSAIRDSLLRTEADWNIQSSERITDQLAVLGKHPIQEAEQARIRLAEVAPHYDDLLCPGESLRAYKSLDTLVSLKGRTPPQAPLGSPA